MTVDHGVTSSFMHKKYGVKTYFIYPHFTEQLSNFFIKIIQLVVIGPIKI